MMRGSRLAVLLGASLSFGAGLGLSLALPRPTVSLFASGARTIYEAIDFTSPRSAASAFLDAWARRDYATAHIVLSPQAQKGWRDQIALTFGMDTLFPGKGRKVWESSGWGGGPEWEEQGGDPTMLFDSMLRAAERLDALPFSAGPNHAIVFETMEKDAARVEAETDGEPARLTMDLVRLPSGRWKVDRLLLPTAVPTEKPWGYATTK
jgi:hypothetical protein